MTDEIGTRQLRLRLTTQFYHRLETAMKEDGITNLSQYALMLLWHSLEEQDRHLQWRPHPDTSDERD